VTKRVSPSSASPSSAIPYAFLNSTVAMIMTFSGFVVHDLLIARGIFGFNVIICFASIIFNLSIVYLWPRLKSFKGLEQLLFVIMSIQWFWVAYAIGGLYFSDYHVAPTTFAVCALLAIVKIARERNNKWISTAAFSFFGTVAMGLTIWQGLDDWSMSATAKLQEVQGGRPKAMEKSVGAGGAIINWSYDGETGPAMWGQLKPEFKQCGTGINQSPIDIPRHSFLSREWASSRWKSESGNFVVEGKSLRLDLSGNTQLEVNRKKFNVKQLYMHSPSEHQLSGLSYPMEMQLLLESTEGEVLALAAFVEIGAENPEFGKIIDKLPLSEKLASGPIENLKISSFFPEDFSAYRYSGSLTVPPCTEGFSWSVLRKPVEFSAAQINTYRKIFPVNARPVQSFGGRKFDVSPISIAH